MIWIESKYLNYCKTWRILPQDQKRSTDQNIKPIEFMKNKNNKVLVTSIVLGAIALIAVTKMAASVVPGIVIAGSYLTVAVLFAFAAVDYGMGSKDHSAR